MKIRLLTGLLCLIPTQAAFGINLFDTFNPSEWSTAVAKGKLEDDGWGWGPGPGEDYKYTFDGFTSAGSIVSGSLDGNDTLGITGSGSEMAGNYMGAYAKWSSTGFGSLIGESVSLKWTDGGVGTPSQPMPQWVFFSGGTVDGVQSMIGFQLNLSATPGINTFTLDWTASNFTLVQAITFDGIGGIEPPEGTTNVQGTSLTEAQFTEFMNSCDAMYFRMNGYMPNGGNVGGTTPDYVNYTQIYFDPNPASIPEPSVALLGIGGLIAAALRRTRR